MRKQFIFFFSSLFFEPHFKCFEALKNEIFADFKSYMDPSDPFILPFSLTREKSSHFCTFNKFFTLENSKNTKMSIFSQEFKIKSKFQVKRFVRK